MTWSRTASLYAVKKASETIHVQMNEVNMRMEVVNNTPDPLTGLTARATIYDSNSKVEAEKTFPVANVPGSTTVDAGMWM